MSTDMNLIMENWRRSPVLTEGKIDLFEDLEYIKEVLGIQVPLNENNKPILSEELKKEVILRENAFTDFMSRFNPIEAVKKYGQEIGDMFTTLHDIAKDPRKIGTYIQAVVRKIVNPMFRKMEKLIDWVRSKGMEKIAAGIQSIYDKMKAVKGMPKGWKKALTITSLVVGGYYIWGKLKDYGVDLIKTKADALATVLTGFNQEKLQNILTNFFMKEMPKIALKLFGVKALLATTGFAGLIVLLKPFLDVLEVAKDELKDAIEMFKRRSRRADDRAERVRRARLRGETGIVLET